MKDEDLINAVADFRVLCKKLIFELGGKFDLDIQDRQHYDELVWVGNKNIPRTGQLNSEWKYSFHGTQCGFYKRNGQTVEVELSDHPNFRVVEPWFLKEFIDTTSLHNSSIMNLTWQALKKKLEDSYASNQIIEVRSN